MVNDEPTDSEILSVCVAVVNFSGMKYRQKNLGMSLKVFKRCGDKTLRDMV